MEKDQVSPEIMHKVVDQYGLVENNLRLHDRAYPSAQYLSNIIAAGQSGYGLAATGPGKHSAGADLLQKVIERDSRAPLHIAIWGGQNTLAQALLQLRASHSSAEVTELLSHIEVYAISDQDDAGPWIRKEFPAIRYIVDPSSVDGSDYARATWTGISGDMFCRNAPGADFTTVSNPWLDAQIRSQGPLGKAYPQYKYVMEGDTPSFLGLIRNGLDSEMNPGWGGWGGFWPGSPNAADTVVGIDGKSYTSNQATIWYWRAAFQNDFAARMAWTWKDYAQANHPPLVVVNGDKTNQPLHIELTTGRPKRLDASGSTDPDRNHLTYHWFVYEEAGLASSSPAKRDEVVGRRGEEKLELLPRLALKDADHDSTTITALRAGTTHVILAVTDDGSPALTRYRRVIVTTK